MLPMPLRPGRACFDENRSHKNTFNKSTFNKSTFKKVRSTSTFNKNGSTRA